ncbi:MAG: flagellar motor switch protein FliN [Actinomycetota bacterium]
MTTQAEPGAAVGGGALDHDQLLPGGRTLAASMGIDAEPERAEPWPIDVGQRSLTAGFHGGAEGTIYLSVAEADADRLVADTTGADGVIRDLVASLGIDATTIETTPFEPAADLPSLHVVVRGDDKIVGFGVTLGAPDDAASVPTASFEPAPMTPTPTGGVPTGSMGAPISLLADVDMQVTVELGRTTLPVRELLSLQPGMVVELERQAGAPIDVMVNGRLIARGEVVVLDEQFGLRVTEIVADAVGGR